MTKKGAPKPEHVKAANRKYMETYVYPGGVEARRSYYYKYHLQKRYGLSQQEWDDIFQSQGYRCAACGTEDPGPLKWWHTHHTGSKKEGTIKVHGILCGSCNFAARNGTIAVIHQLEHLAAWLRTQL